MGSSKQTAEQPAAETAVQPKSQPQNGLAASSKHQQYHSKLHAAEQPPMQQANATGAEPADAAAQDRQNQLPRNKKKKLLTEEKLKRLKEQHDKRGIIYISRLPPHMKPAKLRQLLSQYGEVGRIYCTPEDQALRQQRKKKGGNSGKNFTEGWVEFEDKSVAKSVAASLNGQQIGGKRRSAYHFDLWCMKYLPKFKWDHLTEEINYEKAVREQRMAQELSAAKRERDFYLSRVDKAKAQQAMAERRQKKQKLAGEDGQTAVAAGDAAVVPAAAAVAAEGREGPAAAAAAGVKRMYGQRKVKADPTRDGAAEIGEDVLGLIVAKKQKRS